MTVDGLIQNPPDDPGPRRCPHAYRRLIPIVPWSAPIWWVDEAHAIAQGKHCQCILPEGHERHTAEAQGRPCECVHGPRIHPDLLKDVQQRRRGFTPQQLIVIAALTILMLSIPFVWRQGDPSRLLFLIFAVGYFLPTCIAIFRHHPETKSIIRYNAFLGWNVLIWIGAVIWALETPTRLTHEEVIR